MIRRMLSILEARNSGMFCHTGTPYSKIGRTIVANTLANEADGVPLCLRTLREQSLLFAFLIM